MTNEEFKVVAEMLKKLDQDIKDIFKHREQELMDIYGQTKSNHPKHAQDEKNWGQREVEEHQASLVSGQPCYFCRASQYQLNK